MKWLLLIALLITFAFASDDSDASSNVVVLTPENFKEVVDGSKHVLVEFYAPWCGHCKNLVPIYEELANAYAFSKDIVIAKVDADAHRDLGTQFGVQGFPTLKWFPKGSTEPDEYNSGRDLDAFLNFIQQRSGIAGKVKKTASAVLALTVATFNEVALNESVNALVEFYAPWCGHCKSLAPIYEKVGHVFENEPTCKVAKVDATAEPALGTQYNIQGYPTIKFFAAGKDKEPMDYEGGRSLEAFVLYLNDRCGTARMPDGRLSETAGVVVEFLPLVHQWNSASKEEDKKKIQKSFKETAKTASASASSPYHAKAADYYVKVVSKALSKGLDYPMKEFARLERLLSQGKDTLVAEKLDSIVLRMNILRSFAGAPVQQERDEL